jgi:hypothetical protein
MRRAMEQRRITFYVDKLGLRSIGIQWRSRLRGRATGRLSCWLSPSGDGHRYFCLDMSSLGTKMHQWPRREPSDKTVGPSMPSGCQKRLLPRSMAVYRALRSMNRSVVRAGN